MRLRGRGACLRSIRVCGGVRDWFGARAGLIFGALPFAQRRTQEETIVNIRVDIAPRQAMARRGALL